MLLRNPIERAFAHWNMQRFKGREPLDFLEAVKAEKERAEEAAPLQSRRYSYVDRGFYGEQLERVFSFFPRAQVKVIKSEEFQNNNRETVDAIFRFLGVGPVKMRRNKDRNVVPYERAITSEEKAYLLPIFAEDIAKLERMLGWDCADWKRQGDPAEPERGRLRSIAPTCLLKAGARISDRSKKALSSEKMRAPCERKQARSSGVKNELPSERGLKSRRRRPAGFRNCVRMSLMKNSQLAGVHSFQIPFGSLIVRWKQTRCAVTRSNFSPRSGRGTPGSIREITRGTLK